MKNISKFLCLTLLSVCMVFSSLHAEKVKGVRRPSSPKAESATCLPASSSNELTVNNVRAYIETGGTMWFKELAEYEIPAGSGKTSMFCAALWIGGRDANGMLKLAAVRFRQVGDDFWTGPLKFTGASTTQSMCIKYPYGPYRNAGYQREVALAHAALLPQPLQYGHGVHRIDHDAHRSHYVPAEGPVQGQHPAGGERPLDIGEPASAVPLGVGEYGSRPCGVAHLRRGDIPVWFPEHHACEHVLRGHPGQIQRRCRFYAAGHLRGGEHRCEAVGIHAFEVHGQIEQGTDVLGDDAQIHLAVGADHPCRPSRGPGPPSLCRNR